MQDVMRDLESSCSGRERTRLCFDSYRRSITNSPRITPADMQPLYEVGWDDEAIYYAITVCALFNFYNRWIDATGVHALSDEAHREGGKRTATNGYVRK